MSEGAPSFYARALAAAEQRELEEARKVEGLEQEIALLRYQLARLMRDEDADPALIQSGVRALIATMLAQHRLSPRQAEGLAEAAAQLLEEFGAMLQGDP